MTITLADLNKMTLPAFAAAVGDTFELAPWVAEAAFANAVMARCRELDDVHEGSPRVGMGQGTRRKL